MSDLIVTVRRIDKIKPHPNADKLEIAVVGGWEVITGLGNHKEGDLVVHIPPDAMVPLDWSVTWGVKDYLSWKKHSPDGGRVRTVSLRGYHSYGFLVPNESGAALGDDLAAHYGITKYEPPVKVGMQAGQMRVSHPYFHQYTDIQNLRNYPESLNYNARLIVTEKLHGTNSRIGVVKRHPNYLEEPAWDVNPDYEVIIGTHRTQRKVEDAGIYGMPFAKYKDQFEHLFQRIILNSDEEIKSIIVFGEIYGAGVQDLTYNTKETQYAIFDIAVNGEYIHQDALDYFLTDERLPGVPILSKGFFTFDRLIEYSQGVSDIDFNQIKEGIVVKPMIESTWGKGDFDPNPKRMIFKVINPDYLTRKNATEYH